MLQLKSRKQQNNNTLLVSELNGYIKTKLNMYYVKQYNKFLVKSCGHYIIFYSIDKKYCNCTLRIRPEFTIYNYESFNNKKCTLCNRYTYLKKNGLIKNKITNSIINKNFKSKKYTESFNIFKARSIHNRQTTISYDAYKNYIQDGNTIGDWNEKFHYPKKYQKKIGIYCPYLIMHTFSKIKFEFQENDIEIQKYTKYNVQIYNFNTNSPNIVIKYNNSLSHFKAFFRLTFKCFSNIKSLEIHDSIFTYNFYFGNKYLLDALNEASLNNHFYFNIINIIKKNSYLSTECVIKKLKIYCNKNVDIKILDILYQSRIKNKINLIETCVYKQLDLYIKFQSVFNFSI